MTTFKLLTCPTCRETGKINILPWGQEDGFTALSAICGGCKYMTILRLDAGEQLRIGFHEPGVKL